MKMGDKKQTINNGTGFCGLLTIAFIVLKLLKVIDWSWVWVLAPLWITASIGIIIILIAVLLFIVGGKK
jgi:hypothetical protein